MNNDNNNNNNSNNTDNSECLNFLYKVQNFAHLVEIKRDIAYFMLPQERNDGKLFQLPKFIVEATKLGN